MTQHCSNVPQARTAPARAYDATVRELFRRVAAGEMSAEDAQVEMDLAAKALNSAAE